MTEKVHDTRSGNYLMATGNRLQEADPELMSRFILESVPRSKGTVTILPFGPTHYVHEDDRRTDSHYPNEVRHRVDEDT